jgi:C-terminal processing protease CtpA/Prc
MNERTQLTTKNGILFAVLLIFLFVTQACKKSPEIDPYNEEFVKVNSWVTEEMRFWYYWNKEIPVNDQLNLNLIPDTFFYKILSKDDRFSWIDKVDKLNEDLAGVSTTTGMNFGVLRDGNDKAKDSDPIIGFVRYVVPESPAERAGIERGMFFTKVNGKAMIVGNYKSLLLDPYNKGEGFSVQLAELDGNDFVETKEIDLASVKISEPAVYLYNTITTKSGRKVGYLFYNRFLRDSPERSHSDELFEAFQYFKANGVQDLILDIRYNLGGDIAISGLLSALIMPNYDENKVFVEYKYNEDLNELLDAFRFHTFKSLFPKPPSPIWGPRILAANLNLNKVYVLATYNSASASELVINNLRPYMEVVHIGETTRGKNEGSTTLEDERVPREIEWAIQPIILKLANAEHYGDYHDGLNPIIEVKEGYELKPLGDKEDPLVKVALAQIDPSMSAKTRATPPRVLSMLKGIKSFDEINNKAKPILVDETINRKLLRRVK